jgi:hypothetical protein
VHPYITATLAAERHRELADGVRRARRGRPDPGPGRLRRAWATWREARDSLTVPAPGPTLQDYPLRRSW